MIEMRTGGVAIFLVLFAWFWDDIIQITAVKSIFKGTGVVTVTPNTNSVVEKELVVDVLGFEDSSNNFQNTSSNEVRTKTKTKKKPESYGGGSAFCLIIKDDNEILSEWIAYHYHVFNMRRLIVALDPTSLTSPAEILEPFEKNFGLNVSIWNDEDYTPDWWIERQPIERQAALNLVNPTAIRICEKSCKIYDPEPGNPFPSETGLEPGDEYVERCNHIFRQRMFYGQCSLRIKEEAEKEKNKEKAIKWTVFTDTDEYMVPNPWVDHYIHAEDDKSLLKASQAKGLNYNRTDAKVVDSKAIHRTLNDIYPIEPTAGSLWKYFNKFKEHVMHSTQKCVMMPRIQFGGNEDESEADASTLGVISSKANNTKTTTVWSHQKIDSLRYMYHRNHDFDDWPKGMLNVESVGIDEMYVTSTRKKGYTEYGTNVFNPQMHYPHKSCDWVDKKGTQTWSVMKNNPHWWHQPMAHHHYVGPLDRFLGREDQRRTIDLYKARNDTANYALGDQNYAKGKRKEWTEKNPTERWWIKGWLDSFVATHGSEMAYSVLGDQYATRTTTSLNQEL